MTWMLFVRMIEVGHRKGEDIIKSLTPEQLEQLEESIQVGCMKGSPASTYYLPLVTKQKTLVEAFHG